MLRRLDLYLSSGQLGITVSSLILGWLAEPAIARLLLEGARALGWQVGQPLLHGVSLGVALAIVTTLHMTLGEQAPKIFAVHRPEATALRCAYPLRFFTLALRPLIWIVNRISNFLLLLGGVKTSELHEGSFTADELRGILTASARAGHISSRQRTFAENVLGFIDLQVRHILVPRGDRRPDPGRVRRRGAGCQPGQPRGHRAARRPPPARGGGASGAGRGRHR